MPLVAQSLKTLTDRLSQLNQVITKKSAASTVAGGLPKVELSEGPIVKPGPFATHALLIFLDDSEDVALGALSSVLLQALMQAPCPIIASASLIANLNDVRQLKATNPQVLFSWFDAQPPMENGRVKKDIFLNLWPFKGKNDQNFVVKQINSFLCLLIPKTYLQRQQLSIAEVEQFQGSGAITPVEQKLGLKVNHMKTVVSSEIKKPLPAPSRANYFVENLASIFVTKKEYPLNNKKAIPQWAMVIGGHGAAGQVISDLLVEQFKQFLQFLENKIRVKLLYYFSCYAAGKNIELLYNDAKQGVGDTYSFPIIVSALTDAVTSNLSPLLTMAGNALFIAPTIDYASFFAHLMSSPVIQFDKELFLKASQLNNLTQIRFPGLPWFSVIEQDKVVSIGSVLAKTRTQPLDITTFFARSSSTGENRSRSSRRPTGRQPQKSKIANPLGVLLYTANVPFELIINTPTMPAFISMLPGSQVHTLKKISSTKHSLESIVESFMKISDMAYRKIFMVDEITAPFGKFIQSKLGAQSGTFSNVIIYLDDKAKKTIVYGTFNKKAYKMIPSLTPSGNVSSFLFAELTQEEQQAYEGLRRAYGSGQKLSLQEVETQAKALFSVPLSLATLMEKIRLVLDMMPDNSMLRLPQLLCTEDLQGMGRCLMNYGLAGNHKIVWFAKGESFVGQPRQRQTYQNVILDVRKKEGMRIFLSVEQGRQKMIWRLGGQGQVES